MNVTTIVVELLNWNGQLKTLTYRPARGRDLWVAWLDEYRDQRSGPFYLLDPDQEQEFALRLKNRRARIAGRYERLDGEVIRFQTEWRGIRTEPEQLSCYALCLPPEATPDSVEFTDPHKPGRSYRYTAMYDDQHGRIVCYLSCRSRFGSFDFNLTVTFHRDAEACRNFATVSSGAYEPDIEFLVDVAAEGKRRVVQQFFGPGSVAVGDHGIAISGPGHRGPVIAGGVGMIGAVGDHAVGAVHAGETSPMTKLVGRARKSRQSQVFGLSTLFAIIIATVLLLLHITDIGIAGYVIAVLTLLATLVPLFRSDKG